MKFPQADISKHKEMKVTQEQYLYYPIPGAPHHVRHTPKIVFHFYKLFMRRSPEREELKQKSSIKTRRRSWWTAPGTIIDDFIVNKYFLISNLIAILYRTKTRRRG